jgi:hypothetical protein
LTGFVNNEGAFNNAEPSVETLAFKGVGGFSVFPDESAEPGDVMGEKEAI